MRKTTLLKSALLTCLALLLTGSLFAQTKGFKSYWNEKYQYSILIPEDFGGMGESESGDGQTFVSPDGDTHIQVYGGYNAQAILGTSFDEEYQATLKKLNDRKVQIIDSGTADDPYEEFDWDYTIQYVEAGLYHSLRSVWWGDHYASVDFWCYQEDKARYVEDGVIDRIVYSLGPDDGTFKSESNMVRDWCSGEDYYLNVYVDGTLEPQGKQPTIEELFLSFAVSNQTPLTMMGLEKINDPTYEFEDIVEWILDNKNNYLMYQLVSDSDYWLEACSWDKDNGHKLFLINYNAPNQVLLCFDYDPKEQVLYPDHTTLQLLQDMPKAIVRLPHQGKTMDIYYYKDLSKVVSRLSWNGKRFDLIKN